MQNFENAPAAEATSSSPYRKGSPPSGMNLSKHLRPCGRDEISWSDISISPGVMVGSGKVMN
jgi:hypothetical protein